MSEDEEEVDEDAKELLKARQDLSEQKQAIDALQAFYKDIKEQWGDTRHHTIGHIHYSPPISVDVVGERYTEDWGSFELEKARFEAHFKGNVIDLGVLLTLLLIFITLSNGITIFCQELQ